MLVCMKLYTQFKDLSPEINTMCYTKQQEIKEPLIHCVVVVERVRIRVIVFSIKGHLYIIIILIIL